MFVRHAVATQSRKEQATYAAACMKMKIDYSSVVSATAA